MPITQRNGDTVTVTISPDEEQKLKQFEQEAIKNNLILNQHGASMIEKEEQPLRHNNSIKSIDDDDDGLPNFLKIHRVMKKIVGIDEETTAAGSYYTRHHSALKVQPHVASTSTSNKIDEENNKNVILMRLMKKIANSGASPL
jgi:hypothetical protein